jgi:hypothetical protein
MAGVALRVDLRSSSVLEACFHWFCIDTFVYEVKVSAGIVSFTPVGIDSALCGHCPTAQEVDLHGQPILTFKKPSPEVVPIHL